MLELKLQKLPALVPAVLVEPIQSFGERSILKNMPRAGTAECIEECFFAIVSKESYLYVLKRVEVESNMQFDRFLRQIPYIKGWIYREVFQFKYLMKIEHFEKRGQVLAKEG